MQLKKTKLLFIVTLIVLIPSISIETDASSYAVDIYRIPQTVHTGDIVTVYVNVMNPESGEEFEVGTCLDYELNGVMYPDIAPDQSIPAQMQELTWTLGYFETDDFVRYKVHLYYLYADSYESGWMSFGEGTPPPLPKPPREPLTQTQIIYIAAGSVVGFALLAVVAVFILRMRKS